MKILNLDAVSQQKQNRYLAALTRDSLVADLEVRYRDVKEWMIVDDNCELVKKYVPTVCSHDDFWEICKPYTNRFNMAWKIDCGWLLVNGRKIIELDDDNPSEEPYVKSITREDEFGVYAIIIAYPQMSTGYYDFGQIVGEDLKLFAYDFKFNTIL